MGVEKKFCGRVLLNRRKSAARRQAWRVPVLKGRHSEDRVCWVPRGMWVTFSRSECCTSRAVVVRLGRSGSFGEPRCFPERYDRDMWAGADRRKGVKCGGITGWLNKENTVYTQRDRFAAIV